MGVAPEGFFGTFVGWGMQFWVPASMEDIFESGGYKLEDRGARWIESYARLKPGVTLQQAQQEVAAISGRLAAEYPATNRGRSIRLWPLWQTPFNNAGTLLPTLQLGTDVYKINAGKPGQLMIEGEDQWIYASLINTTNGATITTGFLREGDGGQQ